MSGRILIADEAAGERIVLKARLTAQAYRVSQAATVLDLLRQAAEPPDLVLLPPRLEDEDGIALARRLRGLSAMAHTSTILRLDRPDCATRIQALEAGVDAVVDAAAPPVLLDARIRCLLRRHAAEAELALTADTGGLAEPAAGFKPAGRIVLIAPHLRQGIGWRTALSRKMRDAIQVLPEPTALAALAHEPEPDAILVAEDPDAPARSLQLVADLRCRSHTMRAAIILLQEAPAPERAAAALDAGVEDVAEDGFDPEETALRLRRELARKMHRDSTRAAVRHGLRLAMTDPLTGLFNRRYAMARLEHFAAEAARGDTPFAVLALDLDRFKTINDRCGHAGGDAVLVAVAERMRRCLRQGDLLARIGGEEFLAVLQCGTLEMARRAADRIRRAVAETPVPLPGGRGEVGVTVSIGLAMSDGRAAGTEALLDRADRALYGAKADGRNLVVCANAA